LDACFDLLELLPSRVRVLDKCPVRVTRRVRRRVSPMRSISRARPINAVSGTGRLCTAEPARSRVCEEVATVTRSPRPTVVFARPQRHRAMPTVNSLIVARPLSREVVQGLLLEGAVRSGD
jgi:hypothetical protein